MICYFLAIRILKKAIFLKWNVVIFVQNLPTEKGFNFADFKAKIFTKSQFFKNFLANFFQCFCQFFGGPRKTIALLGSKYLPI
jgi:hypothetical protein